MFEQDYQDFTADVPAHTLARFLAHADLFRRVMDVSGAIIDIGVGRGGSTFAWAKMSCIFRPGGSIKHVYGFDTFSGFPEVSPEDGGAEMARKGGLDFGDTPFTHFKKPINARLPITFIAGDVTHTLPVWLRSMASRFCISLLNLDADLYAPTKAALTHLMPRMSPGGIVIFDDYDVPDFPGEARAVQEYFGAQMPHLRRFTWYNNPSAYFIV